MPYGELLIKTHKTNVGRDVNGYIDAFNRYGLSLEDGSMSRLLVEPGNKEPVGNSNAITSGVSYLGGTIGVKDAQTIQLEAHICAPSEALFLARLELFCNEVLRLDKGEFIRLKTDRHPNRVYRVMYQNFQQFSTFNMEMAKFTWTLREPHPELRDAIAPTVSGNVVAVVYSFQELDDDPEQYSENDLAIILHADQDWGYGIGMLACFRGGGWEDYGTPVNNGDVYRRITDYSLWKYTGGTSPKWDKHWY